MAETDILERIKSNINLVDYGIRLGFTPVRKGRYVSFKEHDSIMIDTARNRYRRYSRADKEGYGSIIDFVMDFEDKTFPEAVKSLKEYLGNDLYTFSSTKKDTPAPPPNAAAKMVLPEETKSNFKRLFAYLCNTRKIDAEIITDLVKRKMLYESEHHHNAVFVSYSKSGSVDYAFQKSTLTDQNIKFQQDIIVGKVKNGFMIDNHADTLIIGEAIIDILSVATILKQRGKDYRDYNYFSIQGNNIKAVKQHVMDYPAKHIVMVVDNDEVGDRYRAEIRETLIEMGWHGKFSNWRPSEKDFNVVLQKAAQERKDTEYDR